MASYQVELNEQAKAKGQVVAGLAAQERPAH
jgi:hypothetical protein